MEGEGIEVNSDVQRAFLRSFKSGFGWILHRFKAMRAQVASPRLGAEYAAMEHTSCLALIGLHGMSLRIRRLLG